MRPTSRGQRSAIPEVALPRTGVKALRAILSAFGRGSPGRAAGTAHRLGPGFATPACHVGVHLGALAQCVGRGAAALLEVLGATTDRRVGLRLVDLGHFGIPLNKYTSKQKCCISNAAMHNTEIGQHPP